MKKIVKPLLLLGLPIASFAASLYARHARTKREARDVAAAARMKEELLPILETLLESMSTATYASVSEKRYTDDDALVRAIAIYHEEKGAYVSCVARGTHWWVTLKERGLLDDGNERRFPSENGTAKIDGELWAVFDALTSAAKNRYRQLEQEAEEMRRRTDRDTLATLLGTRAPKPSEPN